MWETRLSCSHALDRSALFPELFVLALPELRMQWGSHRESLNQIFRALAWPLGEPLNSPDSSVLTTGLS